MLTHLPFEDVHGVLAGTSAKRLQPIHGTTYGVLLVWLRNDRSQYTLKEMKPSQVTSIARICGQAWFHSSCAILYSFTHQIQQDGSYKIPDLTDILPSTPRDNNPNDDSWGSSIVSDMDRGPSYNDGPPYNDDDFGPPGRSVRPSSRSRSRIHKDSSEFSDPISSLEHGYGPAPPPNPGQARIKTPSDNNRSRSRHRRNVSEFEVSSSKSITDLRADMSEATTIDMRFNDKPRSRSRSHVEPLNSTLPFDDGKNDEVVVPNKKDDTLSLSDTSVYDPTAR